MATLAQIVYDIAEEFGKAEDLVFIERLKFKVNNFRALLLRRDIEKSGRIPTLALTPLPCLDVVRVNASECPDIRLSGEVVRTKLQLPELVNLKNVESLTFVGTIDRSRSYGRISPHQVRYQAYSRYGAAHPGYYIHNGYVYIYNDFPSKISVEGVFVNPDELSVFKDCSGNTLYDENSRYPVSADMIQRITQSICSEIRNLPEDKKVEIND